MTPAGTVVVVDGGKLPGERSKRRRVPESIVHVYYVHTHHVRAQESVIHVYCVHTHHVRAQEHCTCVLRAHHVRVQEQLVASAPDQYADSAGPARCEGAHLYADQ